jgi:hypothetical protein
MTIDRAAKAIGDYELTHAGEPWLLPKARAALAAIKEPTEAMIEDGANIAVELGYQFDCVPLAKDVWRAMHKAMMEDGE